MPKFLYIRSSKQPSFDLNVSTAEQAVIDMNEKVLLEVKKQKQALADLLEPLLLNEARRYPGINIEGLPSPTEMVELLISRIGSQKAREENNDSGPQAREENNGSGPELKTNLQNWP